MRKFYLHILLFLSAFTAVAQTYDFKNYNVDDGLAQSQVFCIFQNSKGFMWFGTNSGGACKFDGKTFKSLTPANDGLSNYIYSITEDKNQNMYFGTYDGLQISGQFKNIVLDSTKGLPHNTVFKVFIDNNEKVWAGTQKGVCYLDKNNKPIKLTGDKTLEESAIWAIYQDSGGDFWFGTIQNGACRYSPSDKKYTWFNTSNGFRENFTRAFNEDNKGNVLIGTVAGLYKVDRKNKIETFVLPDITLSNLAITSIIKDKNQTLWLGTNEGIIKMTGVGYQKFSEVNGLCSNLIISSCIDDEGNYWFGSDGFGVSKLSSEAIVNYSERDKLPGSYINCIYQTKDKNYWFGIRDNGLVCLKGKTMTNFRSNNNLSAEQRKKILVDNSPNCMAEDNQGQLWVGTQAGLSILKDGKATNFLGDSDYETIYSICHAHSGIHYIGTSVGLYTFVDNKAVPVDAVNKLHTKGDFAIYSIVEDNEHNLWIATVSGVIKYNGKSAQLFNAKNKFTSKTVYCAAKDNSNNLWFGSEEGLFYYNHKEFVNLGEKEGLTSNQVCFLVFDNLNRVWIGTNKGIDALSANDFIAQKKIVIKHLGREEGLQGLECNLNSAYKDVDGKLWFGTVKGITVYNPRYEKINYHEPSCSITDIKISFEKIDLTQYSKGVDSLSGLPISLKLPFTKNHVSIDFIGISQTNPSKVQYQFKLDGVDKDWVPATTKTEVTYSSLQPGKYTFYLKAMNNDGFWNKEPLTFNFTVLPPWYRTWWFYTICGIVALASIYSYNTYKTKKLQQDKIKLEKEVRLRTRELREEKEKVEVINKEVIEQKVIIEHKNLEMTDSIKYAKNIQEALLPAITNLSKDFPESFVLYMPKDIVSGDFYWFTNRDGKNFFAAADCTGHGVPGAFMSIIGNSLLNEIISEQHVYQPNEILNNLHVGVKNALNHNKGEFERRDGMDIALCAINKETLMLEYAGANRPLWIYRKDAADKAEIIKADKFPIGGLEFDFEEKRQFHVHNIQLQKGDCVYVFSDGYADQFGGEKGKKFMVANLQRALAEVSQKSMKEQYEHLCNVFNSWRGSYEQIDDVLVIGVRV